LVASPRLGLQQELLLGLLHLLKIHHKVVNNNEKGRKRKGKEEGEKKEEKE
jgi:hypothetical protein